MSKFQFSPSRVFNVDESDLSRVPNKIPKVAGKGKRAVSKVTSAEKGQLVTIVCCCSASGNYVLPALIFPRKRRKEELLIGAPPETIILQTESGYINSEIFVRWLRHFQKHVRASSNNSALLTMAPM